MADAAGATITTSSSAAGVELAKGAGTPAPAAPATVTATPAPAAESGKAAEPAKVAAPWMGGEPAKPAVAATTEPAKPVEVKYELKPIEGTTLDPKAQEDYLAFAKAEGLTPAQLQKVYERDELARKTADEAIMKQVQDTDVKNLNEVRAKWGDKFGEFSEDTKRAFDYVDPDRSMRSAMEKAGVAHWPPIVEAFRKFGGLMKNDTLKAPSNVVAGAKDDRSPHEKLTQKYREQMDAQRKQAQVRK